MNVNVRSDVVGLASQLVQIPSVNPMGRPLDPKVCFEHRVTGFLADHFQRAGLHFERQTVSPATNEAPARENILAILPGEGQLDFAKSLPNTGRHDEPSLLMLEVHQDTVPVDGMTIEPWSGEVRDGRVHGRGACDIKGGMAAILTAVERLQRIDPSERPTIVVACSVNEEHGFTGATQICQLWRTGTSRVLPRAPDAILVTEPTMLDVVVAHKGCIRWECHTRGVATHSSQPDQGVNAIYAMAKVVSAFEEYASNVAPTLGNHPILSRPTLSVGTINGGVSVNTVPDHCAIQIDHRILPGQDARDIRNQAIAYVHDRIGDLEGVTFTEPSILANGMPDSHNGPFADSLASAIRRCGHRGDQIGVSYGTDAAALAVDDIPTVVFGPGDIAQAHTKDEWVHVRQLEDAVDILVEFVRC